MREILIGVDGGGTKTKLIALDARSGQTIATASTDSIHALSLGMKTAVENLRAGIAELGLSAQDTILGLSIGDPSIDDSVPTSLAGEEFRREIEAYCSPKGKCFSKSDVFMALYAFSGGQPAALLIAGTGSMGVALPTPYRHGKDNSLVTVGGWCHPTFDPGSGYHIAVQGIQAAIHAFDGVGPATTLCDVILPFFDVPAPRALIDRFNGNILSRSDIAAFAKQVDACATAGDAIAHEILVQEGQMLGKYACSLLRQNQQAIPQIGIYGSVLLHNQTVRRVFETYVKGYFPTARIGVPTVPPEYGAAIFAADALNLDRRLWS